MNFMFRSKPKSSRTAPNPDSYHQPPSYSYESISSDGIPRIRVKSQSQAQSYPSHSNSSRSSRPRTKSVTFTPQHQNQNVPYTVGVGYHYPTMQAAGYSPQMTYAVPSSQVGGYYYGTGGQVVYAPTALPMKARAGPNDSPL